MSSFKEIAEQMVALQEKKNKDYGNAFERSCEKWGIVSALTRLGDKMNRLEMLWKNGGAEVKDEAMEDTLVDLAAYALMTVEWLRKKEDGSNN